MILLVRKTITNADFRKNIAGMGVVFFCFMVLH